MSRLSWRLDRVLGAARTAVSFVGAEAAALFAPRRLPPRERWPAILICHVRDEDRRAAVRAFGLDSPRGSWLPVSFFKDIEGLGPERAFQRAWERHPGKDVVILHPDMAPLPHDRGNRWFGELLARVAATPDAGILACTLLRPSRGKRGRWLIESGGGAFEAGEPRMRGETIVHAGPEDRMAREVAWVTFGGVYLRRSVIDAVGGFDPRYEWGYYMDVDYCLEARARGFRVVQLPVRLLHAANGTTGPLLAKPSYRAIKEANRLRLKEKWAATLSLP